MMLHGLLLFACLMITEIFESRQFVSLIIE